MVDTQVLLVKNLVLQNPRIYPFDPLCFHPPPMFEYLCECFEWVDVQLSGINWKAVGLAKCRLSHEQFIRISKTMHLSMTERRQQKAKITKREKDASCHCCGEELEDQNYLYICKHAKMATTIAEGTVKIEKTFADENKPQTFAMAFIERMKHATNTLEERK